MTAWALVRGLQPRKIMFIGIDGGDWQVINPLIEEGKLPNIAKIKRDGSSGVLLSPEGYVNSPPSWTSIATGKTVAKHGVTTSVVPRYDVKAKTFWEAAIGYGKKICCINWICNYQAQVPGGNVMITGPYKVSVSPPEIAERIKKVTATYRNDVNPRQVSQEFLDDAISIEEERAAVALEFLKDPFDIFAVTFTGTDRISHFFWKFYEPDKFENNPEDQEKFGNAVEQTYMEVDRLIGQCMEHMTENTNLVLVSDHGFQARTIEKYDYSNIRPNYILGQAGLTTMIFHGTPVKEQSVAWEENLGSNNGNMVYVRVNEEHLDQVENVVSALMRFKIESDEKPLFSDFTENNGLITFSVRPGSFKPVARAMVWNGAEMVRQPAEQFISQYYTRSGMHRRQGIIAMYGKDVRSGYDLGEVDVYDVAPTVLYLAGLPYADDMDGEVLSSCVRLQHKLINRPYSVPTFDSQIASMTEVDLTKPAGGDSGFDADIERKMRSLGYIE